MDAPNSKPHRGLLLTGLLLLVASTGAAFGRIFEGAGLVVAFAGVGVVALLVSHVTRRWPLPLSLLVSAVGAFVAIGLLVFRDTTVVGVPTPSTLEAFRDAFGRFGVDAAEQVPPVPHLPSLVAISVIAIWLTATAAHVSVVRYRIPALGLLPPATLLGFTGLVNAEGLFRVYAAGFLLGAFALLLDSGSTLLGRWGRSRPSTSHEARLRGMRAGRLAVGAVAVAVFLPGILPGFGAAPLLDVKGGGGGVGIRALVDIRPSLNRDDPVELFRVFADRVTADVPAYWRLLSLDEFDGRVWKIGVEGGAPIQQIQGQGPLAGATSAPAMLLRQRILIRHLSTPWLPAAFQPVGIDIQEETVRYDSDRAVITLPTGTRENLQYDVDSQVVQPTPEELEQVTDSAWAASGWSGLERYTRLPADLPPVIGEFARRASASLTSPYARILAIQNYLRTFTYDEEAPAGHGIDDLAYFLLESRRGYCEQFAGTMAVMVRKLGYPARVTIGFLPGELRQDGWRHVTTDDAHSWVEVYFPSFGWLAFEPTPTRFNPIAQPYTHPVGLEAAAGRFFLGEGGFLATNQIPGALTDALELERRFGIGRGGTGGTSPEQSRLPVVIAVVVGALLLVPIVKTLSRRFRRRSARTPHDRVIAWYRYFERQASDLGFGRLEGETLREYGWRLAEGRSSPEPILDRLTLVTAEALYAGRTDEGGPGEIARATRETLRGLRRRAGAVRRVLAAYRLRPTRSDFASRTALRSVLRN
ncbi:MAG: transglutaminase TgpA family protein [Actinomycetota bacterium]